MVTFYSYREELDLGPNYCDLQRIDEALPLMLNLILVNKRVNITKIH